MASNEHLRAAVADMAGQDAEFLALCRKKALGGNGSFAVAYSVLRAVQTITRLGASTLLDEEEAEADKKAVPKSR